MFSKGRRPANLEFFNASTFLNCRGSLSIANPSDVCWGDSFVFAGKFKTSFIAPSCVPSPNTYLPGFKVTPSLTGSL